MQSRPGKFQPTFNDDVLALGYPGWPALVCIEVYGSNNYFTTTQYSKDKCLCGQYVRSEDQTLVFTKLIN